MNPFASRTQKTIDIPFDPPNTVTIRKLAGRHLEKANAAYFNALVQNIRARGGASVQKDIEQLFAKDPKKAAEDVAEVKADPLNGLDKHTVCEAGIVAWTYDAPLVRVKTTDDHGLTTESIPAIEDLDEEALTFFATEIMRLTKPSLFETKDESEAAQKKGEGAPSVA